MKKFKILTCDVSEQYYRDFPAISYSKIAKFESDGPSSLITEFKKSTDSMKFGSIVDTLLTNINEFDNKYIVLDFKKPSDAICEIIEVLYAEVKDKPEYPTLESLPHASLIAVMDMKGYRTTITPDARLKYIFKDGGAYFQYLKNACDKEAVEVDTFQKAITLVNSIKQSKYVPKELFTKTKGVEVLTQSKLFLKNLKSMYDYIIINHNDKTILPIDLKIVDYKAAEFYRSFFKFKYYRQAEVYTNLLKLVIEEEGSFIDYKILPFTFLVASKIENKVLQYQFTPVYVNGELMIFDKAYPSYITLIDQIQWHLDNKEFVYSRQEVEQNGIIVIPNITNITVQENTFLNDENI